MKHPGRSAMAALGPMLALMLAAAPGLAQSDRQPAAVAPETDGDRQAEASVIKIVELGRQGDATVKLYGTAGGDPAMNGLYTYIAFFESPGDGWRVFRIGDFIDFTLASETPGRIVLALRENTMNDATGEIGTRARRIAISWTPGADGAPPARIRITPAP